MAIWEEVKDSVSEHPAYWAGGFAVLAIAVFLYYRSGSSSGSAQPAYNFSYSVGPTAAQVAAGTAQQNQLQADQTAVSLANIAATSQNAQASDYFSFLTSNSANALAATQNTNSTIQAVNANNNQTALTETNMNDQTAGFITGINDNTALAASGLQQQVTSLQSQLSNSQAQTGGLSNLLQFISKSLNTQTNGQYNYANEIATAQSGLASAGF